MKKTNSELAKLQPVRKTKSEKRTLVKNQLMKHSPNFTGRIFATEGKNFIVRVDSDNFDEKYFRCIRAGTIVSPNKNSSILAIGDFVKIIEEDSIDTYSDLPKAVIVEVMLRKTSISRVSPKKSVKEDILASNIDNLLILASIDSPPYNKRLIDRYLVAAELGGVQSAICINKTDLTDDIELFKEDLQIYEDLGYKVFYTSATENEGIDELLEYLKDKTTVISGTSGAGKSTLVNNILQEKVQKVSEISQRTFKGRHTTSASKIFELPVGGLLIDTPGIREFGIIGMEKQELSLYFRDFEPYRRSCKYNLCTHLHEPQCAVITAVENGEIDEHRYQSYLNIYETLE
jgi:ribosome biogenesis GTPase / thiamine phosphate phosphatase